MGFGFVSAGNESIIQTNSFYDVFEKYTNENFENYKHFSGLPKTPSYKEVLDMLKKDAE